MPVRGTIDAIFIVCSCRRSTLPPTKCSTLAALTFWSYTKEGPVVGLEEYWWWRKSCACHPGHVPKRPEWYVDQVSTMRCLAWKCVDIRPLSLTHCSSSLCWKHFRISSALVCHVSLCWWPSPHCGHPGSVYLPSSQYGRLAWKIKGSMSPWRTLSFQSWRNLAPVLSAAVDSVTTPASAHHCRQVLHGWGKVQETLTCPHHQAPLTYIAQQGVHSLSQFGYAPQ